MSLLSRNFLSQLEDERSETESRLEKMSRDMEAVYQSKVTEKLQKLEESKQNVRKTMLTRLINELLLFEGVQNSGNLSIEYPARRRTFTIET